MIYKKLITIVLFSLTVSFTFGQENLKTEEDFKKYFQQNLKTLDHLEGIWALNVKRSLYYGNTLLGSEYQQQRSNWAIKNDNGKLRVYDFLGQGEDIDAYFIKTAVPSVYLYQCTFTKHNATAKANAILNEYNILEYTYEAPKEIVYEYYKGKYDDKYLSYFHLYWEFDWIKVYPTIAENMEISNAISTGTGFALSSDGYIVTNYHVVEGAKDIWVRGIAGDFSKSVNCKVKVIDKNNDLVIIKTDSSTTLGVIPYIIKTQTTDVGESVFVLGYPLTSTMGEEIKLTNGIISSKTGFQGDITSYQISAPVQPGNSGAPLFDNEGNLVGIINAKHIGAENVSYAVKLNYLTNLIDLLDYTPSLQKVSSVSGKPFTQQVSIIKKFVYIIEVN